MANKHMETCSTLLVTGEMQSEAASAYQCMFNRRAEMKETVTTQGGEDMEQLQFSYCW